MGRKRSRKPKIVIKTRNGGFTKLYANGKEKLPTLILTDMLVMME